MNAVSKTSQHTPGPWAVAGDNCGDGSNIADSKGRRIAHTAATRNLNGHALPDNARVETLEAKANAHLVAAAPELLAALEKMLQSEAAHLAGETFPFADVTLAARAAIAKARGQ